MPERPAKPRGLSISLDLEDLGPAVGEDALGQLLRASFTDSKGTTERTVFVPESGGEPTP